MTDEHRVKRRLYLKYRNLYPSYSDSAMLCEIEASMKNTKEEGSSQRQWFKRAAKRLDDRLLPEPEEPEIWTHHGDI